jgi:hypothetical protein
MKRMIILILLVAIATAGGALLGAAAGNAALGAIIGGPVGLLGGYLLGDKFFRDDPGRKK